MQNKLYHNYNQNLENLAHDTLPTSKKVDVNILLNRIRSEKKTEIKKNLLITAGALGTLAITGLITII